MRKSDDVLIVMEGHFWWLGEDIPEGKFAPVEALPGVLVGSGLQGGHDRSRIPEGPDQNDLSRLVAVEHIDSLEGHNFAIPALLKAWVERLVADDILQLLTPDRRAGAEFHLHGEGVMRPYFTN